MIDLDYAATAPVRREAVEAMWPWLTGGYGNPSSVHELGRQAAEALEYARAQVAAAVGGRPGQIVFTSGGTEADVLAVQGIVRAACAPGGWWRTRNGAGSSAGEPAAEAGSPGADTATRGGLGDGDGAEAPAPRIITTPLEHAAVRESAAQLARLDGVEIDLLPVDRQGRVDPADLAALLRPETVLVSVHLANNEIGTVQPIAELAALARAAGVPFHTDAVQAAGQMPLDVAALGVDALSLSGHKVGAPKGVGALWLRSTVAVEPVIPGGGQERERRSGTENVAGAVAFGTALTLAAEEAAGWEEQAALRDAFIAEVLGRVPGAHLTGHPVHRSPRHASFVFDDLHGEAVLVELEARGVRCSSGSACAAGSTEPSPVLTSLGYDAVTARSSVRCTFGATITGPELQRAADALVDAVAAVRRLS